MFVPLCVIFSFKCYNYQYINNIMISITHYIVYVNNINKIMYKKEQNVDFQ